MDPYERALALLQQETYSYEDEEEMEYKEVEKRDIVLLLDQEDHVLRELDIAEISPIIRDASDTGLGKTIAFFELAKRLNLKMVIISPAAVSTSTQNKYDSFNGLPELVYNLSYDFIKGGNSVLVNRYKEKDEYGKIRYRYEASEEFKELVEEGILLVCDEFHHAKNESSAKTHGIRALIKCIVNAFENDKTGTSARSRVVVCSATQMCKTVQAQTFLINMGLIDGPINSSTDGKNNLQDLLEQATYIEQNIRGMENKLSDELRGLQEHYKVKIYSNRGAVLPDAVDNLTGTGGFSTALLEQLCYNITTNVLFKRITSEIRPFLPKLSFNGFFDFHDDDDRRLFVKGINMLLGEELEDDDPDNMLALMTKGVNLIHQGAYKSACDFLYRWYEADPTCKIILCSKQKTDVLKPAVEYFVELGVKRSEIILFTGDVGDAKKKFDLIQKFQEHSNKYRVFLFTTTIGAGFDLHDTNPAGQQRISVCIQDFSAIDAHQSLGRTSRIGMYTFGLSFIWNSIEYGGAFNAIAEKIREKSDVLGMITTKQKKIGEERFFPGNYPRYIDSVYEPGQFQGLYINEEALARKNGGMRLPDGELLKMIAAHDPLPIYDSPLSFIPSNDDFPALTKINRKSLPAGKTVVSDEFNGLEGIYRVNPRITDKYVWTEKDHMDLEEYEILENRVRKQLIRIEKSKQKKDTKKVSRRIPLYHGGK